MLKNNLALAWHFYRHERHMAHNTYLRWAQVVLMVFIVTLSQTSQNIQSYLADNLANLLGADLVISQRNALNETQILFLDDATEQRALTQTLLTTLTRGDQWQRTKLKADVVNHI